MKIKGIYTDRPAIFQLLLLLLFMIAGGALSSLASGGLILLLYGGPTDIMQHPGLLRFIQFMSAAGTFLLPALAMAWTCSKRPAEYLCMAKSAKPQAFFLTLCGMFLLSPLINLTALINKQLTLPSFMSSIESWMLNQEELAKQLTDSLLAASDPVSLVANLFVIAIMAGITEEFIFRGALQRTLERWMPNHHVTIWVAAILFSAFHMQFYGFLPRMILGAYFGYLLYWGKSIWLPVFAHFANNAFAVIAMSDSRLKDNEYITGEIPMDHLLHFCLVATLTTCLFILMNRHLRKMLISEKASTKP